MKTKTNIRQQVREIEKHVKTLADTKAEQIKIIGKAQVLSCGDEPHITILAIVKNRIIHEKA